MNIEDHFVNANSSSDKVPRHGYQRFYPYFLEPFRKIENIKILEIGFHIGNSVQLWKTYFNNPRIFSIDIKDKVDCDLLEAYFKMDQSDIAQIDKFVNASKLKFDVIVDDGSHVPKHQWNTFIRFINLLEDGGVYILEDIETSFWGKSEVYGYKFNSNQSSLIKKMNAVAEIINSEFSGHDLKNKFKLSELEYTCLRQVELCTLGHNCIIFVKKNNTKYKEYYRSFQEYPMKGNIDNNKSRFYKRVVNSNLFKRFSK